MSLAKSSNEIASTHSSSSTPIIDELIPSRLHGTRTPHNAILHSSLLTAAIRRDETDRTDIDDCDKLVYDMYASELAGSTQHHTHFIHRYNNILSGDELAQLQWEVLYDRQSRPEVLIRCKYMDEWLSSTVHQLYTQSQQYIQVLLVGCGMDSRAYRLECMRYCNVYEVDHTVIIDYKSNILSKYQCVANSVNRMGCDITHSQWFEQLLNRNNTTNNHRIPFDSNAITLIIIEGVSMYLTKQQFATLLRQLHTLTIHNNQYVVCDIVNRACISHTTNIQYYHLFKYGATQQQIQHTLYDAGYTVQYNGSHNSSNHCGSNNNNNCRNCVTSTNHEFLYIGMNSISYDRYLQPPYRNQMNIECCTYIIHAVKRTVRKKCRK